MFRGNFTARVSTRRRICLSSGDSDAHRPQIRATPTDVEQKFTGERANGHISRLLFTFTSPFANFHEVSEWYNQIEGLLEKRTVQRVQDCNYPVALCSGEHSRSE